MSLRISEIQSSNIFNLVHWIWEHPKIRMEYEWSAVFNRNPTLTLKWRKI